MAKNSTRGSNAQFTYDFGIAIAQSTITKLTRLTGVTLSLASAYYALKTTASELPATTLASNCYESMFGECTSLTSAPALPATTLVSDCYRLMFSQCTSLVTAPELPATSLKSNCYYRMFYLCSGLNYIKALFTTTPSTSYTYSWVTGVSSTGTFVKNSKATWTTTGDYGVPTGWTVETDA